MSPSAISWCLSKMVHTQPTSLVRINYDGVALIMGDIDDLITNVAWSFRTMLRHPRYPDMNTAFTPLLRVDRGIYLLNFILRIACGHISYDIPFGWSRDNVIVMPWHVVVCALFIDATTLFTSIMLPKTLRCSLLGYIIAMNICVIF
jgi:hypothetical protein